MLCYILLPHPAWLLYSVRKSMLNDCQVPANIACFFVAMISISAVYQLYMDYDMLHDKAFEYVEVAAAAAGCSDRAGCRIHQRNTVREKKKVKSFVILSKTTTSSSFSHATSKASGVRPSIVAFASCNGGSVESPII
jgi:hypothetical protein